MTARRAESGGVRGVGLVTLGNLAPPVIALVTAPILAQALGPVGRGELAAATAPLLFAAAGLTFGIPEAVTYFSAKAAEGARKTLRTAIMLCCVIGVFGSSAIYLLAPVLSGGQDTVGQLISLTGLALAPILAAGCIRGSVRARRFWGLIALEQTISALYRLVTIVVLASAGMLTPLTAAIVTATAAFIGCCVYAVVPFRDARQRIQGTSESTRRVESSGSVYDTLRYGLGVWIGSAAGVILTRFDTLVILPLSDSTQLGLYAVAMSIAEAVRVFNMAVRDVVFSMQASRQDDAVLGRASRASTLVTLIAAIAVSLASIWLVPWLFGAEFSESVPLIVVLLVGTVLGNPGSVLAAGLSARGRPVLRSMAMLLGVVANVLALFLLVPHFGAMGAAMSGVLSNAVTAAAVIIFAKRYFSLHPSLALALGRRDVLYIVKAVRRVVGRAKQ